jgi:hypothetical protein
MRMIVMFDLLSFFLGVVISSIGIVIGIELKIHLGDIIYMLLNRMVKEDTNLKISELPINNDDKK